jgi:hypothetical protein
VLGIAPLGIEVVGAIILALDVHKENSIRLQCEGGDIAGINSSILASIQYQGTSLICYSNIDLLPFVLLREIEVKEQIFFGQFSHSYPLI